MPTARLLIQDALEEIGVGNPGDLTSAADIQLGLRVLDRMLNAWAADETTLAVSNRVTATIPSGTSTMTIGPLGTINTQRPVWIDTINYVVPGSTPPVEVPMGRMTDQQYQALSIKTLSSSLPTQYYYQTSVTSVLGSIFFWPTVDQNVDVVLYLPAAVSEPTTLTTVLTVPPGYQDAIHYDLAYRLCGPFGRPIPDGLPQLRQNALMVMKRPNQEPMILGVDQALVPSYGGAYNVLSDQMTGSR
jgi:hypothetical protein